MFFLCTGLVFYGYRPASSSWEMMIFFMPIMAWMAWGVESRLPMSLGTICQDRPNLSLHQPHCSCSGEAVSFSQ